MISLMCLFAYYKFQRTDSGCLLDPPLRGEDLQFLETVPVLQWDSIKATFAWVDSEATWEVAAAKLSQVLLV